MSRKKKIFLWSFFVSAIITVIVGFSFFTYTIELKFKKEKERIEEHINIFSEMGIVLFSKNKMNSFFTIIKCFVKGNDSISSAAVKRGRDILFSFPENFPKIESVNFFKRCNNNKIYIDNKIFYCFLKNIDKDETLLLLSPFQYFYSGVANIKIITGVMVFLLLAVLFVIHFYVFRYISNMIDKKFKESEDKFRKLVENNQAGVFIIKNGKIVFVNPKAVEILGANDPKEILGRPPQDFVIDNLKKESLYRMKALEDGTYNLPSFRGQLKRIDGSKIWVETKSLPISYEGEKAIQSIVWDITKIKEIEDELRDAKSHLENIYNSSNMIIFSLDREYRYLSFNNLHKITMKQIWGVEIEKGMNMLELIKNPEDREKAKKNFDRALKGEYFTVIEEYGDEKYKRTFYEDIYSPLKNETGKIIGLTVFVRDITEKMEKEKEIEKLSRVVETNPQGIVIVNKNFEIEYANEKSLEIGNWKNSSEVVGKSVFNFLEEEKVLILKDKIIPNLLEGKTWVGELPMFKKDGSIVVTETHISAMMGKDGEIESFLAIFNDITKRKEMEIALQEAYEFTKTILSSIPAAIFSKDREGRYLLVNEEFADYAGMTPEEVRGKTVQECWPSEISKVYHQKDIELMEEDGEQIYEYYLPHKERGNVPGIFHKACFHDAEGKVAGLVGVFLDLSELKKAQAALKESEEKSKAILEALPDIVFTLDDEGKFLTYHSPSDSALLIPPKVFIGKKVTEVLPPFLADLTMKAIDIVKKTNLAHMFEYSIKIENEKRWFEARMVKKGETEFLAIIRDITDKKKLESQLIQSQKMETVGTLAGGIAHDFNNILTVINGYCEIGLKKAEKKSDVKNEIMMIYDATKKAIKLVSQLLAFSRKQIINPKILNINEIINNLYSMLKRLISEDISLELFFEDKELKVRMDPSQIEQILVNLVVNAKDAIEEKGGSAKTKKITIETARVIVDTKYVKEHPGSKEGEYAVLSVSDTGVGMSKEIKEKVFEPFFTTKSTGKGTGLGLSTVYGIVKQNNGFVYLYSEKGEGTTVKVYLPLTTSKGEDYISEDVKFDKELNGKGENILIVEDSPDVKKFLKDALQSLGYNVIESSNGKEALEKLKKYGDKIELVITDLIMPEMDGKELYDRMKEKGIDIKVIFTSGYTENHIAHRGILYKGINLLQKPYSVKDLAEKISMVLSSKK